jgi:hypothetical protein
MKFPLEQLSNMEYNKPLVQVDDTDEWIQWDYCDLEGLPTKRIDVTMTNMGKLPKGQWDNLPDTFTSVDGKEYLIEDIIMLKPSKYNATLRSL